MIELKSAICPECGGLLRLNIAQTSGKCSSCGTTILISGAPGIKQEIAAWITANQHLENGDMDKAAQYFQKVVEINPEFGEAHFGLFECAVQTAKYYRQLNKAMRRCIPDYVNSLTEAINTFGKRAIEYAPDETTGQKYQTRVNEILDEINEIINPPRPEKKKGVLGRLFG